MDWILLKQHGHYKKPGLTPAQLLLNTHKALTKRQIGTPVYAMEITGLLWALTRWSMVRARCLLHCKDPRELPVAMERIENTLNLELGRLGARVVWPQITRLT